MAPELRYDGQVAVVTGAGGGLGRAYALFYASRGAKVVVNDLGGGFNGDGSPKASMADKVVQEIKSAGGEAVADYNDVAEGEKIIETAVKAFGTVHILINNAGILRDVSFKNMQDKDWDLIHKVHVFGAYKTTKAAWPHMRKQKYGRIICTSSGAGLYGSFGQTNYSAAKLALVGFAETLGKEGAKYNINANALTPIAASRLTQTVMPPELLAQLKPEWVVPVVAVLTHKDCQETGAIFEVGAGAANKIRWERSAGAILKTDETMTPSAVSKVWPKVLDYSKGAQYPDGPNDFMGLLEQAQGLSKNEQGEKIDFKGKVALITGAGGGLGRQYALLFAKLGAKVCVNDIVNPDNVVNEIKAMGGEAVGDRNDIMNGAAVVKTVVDAFGTVHIVINNAGILRDKSMVGMTDDLWNSVYQVHATGTYKVTKAAWPYMLKQKYGRIVNTTSTSGIYGNFGQANYSAAKMAILGFSRALYREGLKYNIYVNTIAPNAGTNMTRTVMPEEVIQMLKPDYVAPFTVFLCSDNVPEPATGGLYEVGSGWIGKTRWQRTKGVKFPIDQVLTAEAVADKWAQIVDFSQSDNPESTQDGMKNMMANIQNKNVNYKSNQPNKRTGSSESPYLAAIEKAKSTKSKGTKFTFDDKEVMLYNLGIGAKRTDLKWVFEGADGFEVLPTFGVIPQFGAETPFNFSDIVPNFSMMMLLHGEQYLEIKKFPIPTSGTFTSTPKLIEVVDKGAAGVVVTGTTTTEDSTGDEVFYNESTTFIRGSGNFGGPKKGSDRGAATSANKPPARQADKVTVEKTTEEQAALYRLSGDRNPLHIDPAFSAVGGFKTPILHGLCFFGIAGKHVYQTYGPFKNIKVRFAGVVLPGQTLKTEMWKEGNKVLFQSTVVETGKPAITGGACELMSDKGKL